MFIRQVCKTTSHPLDEKLCTNDFKREVLIRMGGRTGYRVEMFNLAEDSRREKSPDIPSDSRWPAAIRVGEQEALGFGK